MEKKKIPLLSFIFCILFALSARVSGIAYSFLATNVVYADTIICRLLPAVRQVLSALSYACAAGAVMYAYFAGIKSKAPVITYGAVMLADALSVILFDVFSGIFADDPWRLFLGIIYRAGLVIYSVLILILGCAAGKAVHKHKGNTWVSVTVAAILPAVIDLVIVVWKSIAFLIEWEFMPFANEIHTMIFEIGTVILIGILSAIAAVITVRRVTSIE